jgi:integrase/recombinase XerD
LIATYTVLYGSAWRPLTRAKHAADFRRLLEWLSASGRPATTASLDLATLAAYVAELRVRPKVSGWRGAPDARARSLAQGSMATLSANSVNAYMRPLRSLCLWLIEEGILPLNPFRRAHRRAGLHPLLPSEETPTKSATLADLQALARGCAGEGPLELRDQAIVSVLTTTAARNSAVRLLRIEDLDLARNVICFRRGKGGKTLEVALHPAARAAVAAYLERGRPALLDNATDDPGYLFLSAHHARGLHPLTTNSLSLMLRRRYHAGGGTLPTFGSHRIRHATATLLVNHGMPLEEVSRYLGHSSTEVTRRYARQTPDALGARAAEALAKAGLVGG